MRVCGLFLGSEQGVQLAFERVVIDAVVQLFAGLHDVDHALLVAVTADGGADSPTAAFKASMNAEADGHRSDGSFRTDRREHSKGACAIAGLRDAQAL